MRAEKSAAAPNLGASRVPSAPAARLFPPCPRPAARARCGFFDFSGAPLFTFWWMRGWGVAHSAWGLCTCGCGRWGAASFFCPTQEALGVHSGRGGVLGCIGRQFVSHRSCAPRVWGQVRKRGAAIERREGVGQEYCVKGGAERDDTCAAPGGRTPKGVRVQRGCRGRGARRLQRGSRGHTRRRRGGAARE